MTIDFHIPNSARAEDNSGHSAVDYLCSRPRDAGNWTLGHWFLGLQGLAMQETHGNPWVFTDETYGDGSKPLYPCSSHQNSRDLWMFIPLKMVLIGIDPYPYSNNKSWVLSSRSRACWDSCTDVCLSSRIYPGLMPIWIWDSKVLSHWPLFPPQKNMCKAILYNGPGSKHHIILGPWSSLGTSSINKFMASNRAFKSPQKLWSVE